MRIGKTVLEAVVLIGKNGADELRTRGHIQFIILYLNPQFNQSLGDDVIKLLLCNQIQAV